MLMMLVPRLVKYNKITGSVQRLGDGRGTVKRMKTDV